MNRLPFVLPDWTRVAWVSQRAQEVWELRVTKITQAWSDVEFWSVVEGVRPSALQVATAEQLVELSARAAQHGLVAVPLAQEGATGQYSSSSKPVVLGKPWHYRVVITRPERAAAWVEAWQPTDNPRIGELLGYPACCQAFFQRVWIDEKWVDTTWPMTLNTDVLHGPLGHTRTRAEPVGQSSVTLDEAVFVDGPVECNILLRWLGVRLVPHLPCTFNCLATVEFGQRLSEVWERHGYAQELAWAREMLSWPIEWSALHGIAEIKTPVVKVSARTDATAEEAVVRRKGTSYPDEGATGVVFPFRVSRPKITGSKSFQRAFATEAEWKDNGFSTPEAMDQAHGAIVSAVAGAPLSPGAILDLGCGNGALLEKIIGHQPALIGHGIDLEADRVKRARERLPLGRFEIGDVKDAVPEGSRYSAILLMPGRLLEMPKESAQALLARIEAATDHLVLYAYGDWLERHQGLVELARVAGVLGGAFTWNVKRLRKSGGAEALRGIREPAMLAREAA